MADSTIRCQYIGHATILIEVAGIRILTDPWITQRLDRFWEHYPPIECADEPLDVDLILLSHHHYDHFHFPSLYGLKRDALVLYPATQLERAVTGPGGGCFAVPWCLARLGYTRIKPLRPFDTLRLGGATITAFPSAVNFPELSYMISTEAAGIFIAGDSKLHPSTVQYLSENHLHPDVAILPIHSTANDACFRNRFGKDNVQEKYVRAKETFVGYVKTFQKSHIVPGAFGWRVTTSPPPDEDSCAWMNRRMFPLTATDSIAIARQIGARVHCWGPSDRIEVSNGGTVNGEGEYWDDIDRCHSVCSEYTLDDGIVPMPVFNPSAFGTPITADERESIIQFVEKSVPDILGASPFYMKSIESERRSALRISDMRWVFAFSKGDCVVSRSDSLTADDEIWVSESIFLRLMSSDLVFGHTWGTWVGDSLLLDSIFSEPRYYMRYVNKLINTNTVSRYGF